MKWQDVFDLVTVAVLGLGAAALLAACAATWDVGKGSAGVQRIPSASSSISSQPLPPASSETLPAK